MPVTMRVLEVRFRISTDRLFVAHASDVEPPPLPPLIDSALSRHPFNVADTFPPLIAVRWMRTKSAAADFLTSVASAVSAVPKIDQEHVEHPVEPLS